MNCFYVHLQHLMICLNGTIPICYNLLDTDAKIHEYAKNWLKSVSKKTDSFSVDEYNKLVYILKNDIEKYQKLHSDIKIKSQNKRFGVLCLSKSWSKALMWSHYSNNHKGYCIGLFGEKIKSMISGGGGSVIYNSLDEYPLFEPITGEDKTLLYRRLHYKSSDWEYEEEYRLTKIFQPLEPSEADRKITIPDEYFAEVIIGLKADSNTEEEIIDIARKKKMKVYKAIQVPFKFQIDRIEKTKKQFNN